ncbi:ABC transporter ATP-binding protein [Paenibacillus donghaensis]|uniref:Peptide ABC transporter ATP-binding protein n=1 Tax=Paenibacillus donghaensis TaxID=414771 RepID=A0A2Z2KNJ0_9BACL|nr:ABC transporter ATP-binding protein [Paenibacillus donghaensis]ASA25163.1 peptide ABC transporter ATP-binding protein [Paenibacillus donghaensis]
MNKGPLLEVKNLKTHFQTERGKVTAVNGVNLSVNKGEIIGIVGESGCGKSVVAQSILRLLDHTDSVEYEGEVLFENQDLLSLPLSKLRTIRGDKISIIFQDPLSSLNPVYTIGNQIEETLRLHQKQSKKEAHKKAIEILRATGIPSPEMRVNEYPHQLSGGMQQRAMIAMALSCEPKLLIADEPTTALDVTIQAQILELIVELNQKFGMGVLFITHDLGVVSEICTSVKVMYLGQIVEETTTERLFQTPLHPYTQGLIKSIPQLEKNRHEKLHVIEGTVPSLSNIPRGCSFSTRCPFADQQCLNEEPVMEMVHPEHSVKCWHYAEINNMERGSRGGESNNE